MLQHLFPNYARMPLHFVSGTGAWLTASNGEEYLDAIAGLAVCNLGHAHPAVTAALTEQSQKLIHTSNLFHIEWQEKLAEKLCALTRLDAAFFCNSGTEANEAAIKLARLYAHHNNIQNPNIIVMESAFHGRTLGSLSATDSTQNQIFAPLLEGFIRIPYNDIAALEQALQNNSSVCAVLLEPIQGEGGVRIPDATYLKQVRALCDASQVLMILDEIQTGVGRTGRWFCCEHENILPDILTSAKALANGVPIGACLATEKLAQLLTPGMHGSTFGGNPLACRTALSVLETIEAEQLLMNSRKLGAELLSNLREKCARFDEILEVRGKGLMLGIEFKFPCQALTKIALKHRLIINVTAQCVVRLLPPLIITPNIAAQLCDKLILSIEEFLHDRE